MSTGSDRSLAGRGGPLLALLLCAAAMSACAPEPPQRSIVIGRVGGLPPLEAAPALPVRPLKIGTHTRQALRVSGEDAFEVSLAQTSGTPRALSFSTAMGDDGGSVHFSVEALGADGEHTLFEHAKDGPAPHWVDHRVALGSDVRTLRFASRSDEDATGFWGSIVVWGPEPAAVAERPNVVLIVLDTLGARAVGAHGGPAGASPNLDAFLTQAFRFDRALAPYGNTLVSHASLFSALHPLHHGVYPGLPVGPLSSSLVPLLARSGYHTRAYTEGAFISANFGFSVGFDAYDDGLLGLSRQMRGGARETFERAGDWLERHGDAQRFLLFLHTYEVHAPYLPRDEAAREFANALTPGDGRVPSPEEQAGLSLQHNDGRSRIPARTLARLEALYQGELHYLDRVLGSFLARLDASGHADDTLVVLTADHGEQFGEHGKVGHSESLHERVLHVPLAFRWPGVVRTGTSDAPVPLVDVMPTLLDLVGLPIPAGVDGRSLAPLLRGEAALEERPVFSEQRSARGECLQLGLPAYCRLDRSSVRTRRYKLVRSQRPAFERLYDLTADPAESADVADRQPEALARHRALLDAYLRDAPSDAGPEPADPGVDDETLERLRALGYL